MSGEPAGPATHGPVPAWLGSLLAPAYARIIARRNRAFERGVGVTRLDVPVISVGNLSAGGTGKTPMAMHIIAELRRDGRWPCVAMRGYRPRRLGYRPSYASDEADAYRRAFPELPIVAQPDRLAGLARLRAAPAQRAIDRVVLDDGFQHRQIARDLDIVLIDATRPPMREKLLPRGYLREPMSSLTRADAIVTTHAGSVDSWALGELQAALASANPRAHLAITRHLWTGVLSSAEDAPPMPLDVLLGKRVLACCAIGNPEPFLRTLQTLVGGPVGEIILPDHDPFAEHTTNRVIAEARRSGAAYIVVTDKDWSKLRLVPPERWPCPVVRPQLTLAFDSGGEVLGRLIRSAGSKPAIITRP